MSPIKRFSSILTEYVYWDAFHHEFFIDRKIFNKSCKAKILGERRNQKLLKHSCTENVTDDLIYCVQNVICFGKFNLEYSAK